MSAAPDVSIGIRPDNFRQALLASMTHHASISPAEALRQIDAARVNVKSDDALMADWAENYGLIHRHRLAEDLAMVSGIASPGESILEYGSSPPFLTAALVEMGYRVTGLDIDPTRFAPTIRDLDLDIRKSNFEIETLPFEDEVFDVVLFNEVFEHLRIDLIFTMSEAHRVLKKGGALLLSTPNMRSLRGLWMLLRHHTSCHIGHDLFAEYDKLRRYGHMGHVREYTAREVTRFVMRIGFSINRIIYRSRSKHIRVLFGIEARLGHCRGLEGRYRLARHEREDGHLRTMGVAVFSF